MAAPYHHPPPPHVGPPPAPTGGQSANPHQNRTLHVTGISPMVDEMLLSEIFGAFGALQSCKITRDAAGVHGYCSFSDYGSASTALSALNGREVLGSQLGVAWHIEQKTGAKEDTTSHITVFVGNIGDQIDEYTLFEAFAQYNCSDSRVIRGDDGRCLGYGFVTIRTQDDANAAVTAMDSQRLMGRPLRVSLARTPRHSDVGISQRPTDPPPSTDINVVARQSTETNCTVHVGNLLGTESEDTLKKAFAEFGTIDNVRLPGKNFGFVAYTTHMAAAAAIAALHGKTPNGFTRPLRCTWASERAGGGGASKPPGAAPAAPPAAAPGYPQAPGYGQYAGYVPVWDPTTQQYTYQAAPAHQAYPPPGGAAPGYPPAPGYGAAPGYHQPPYGAAPGPPPPGAPGAGGKMGRDPGGAARAAAHPYGAR